MSKPELRFLSLGELSRRANMSKSTVQRMLVRGEIAGTQDESRQWSIPVAELEKLTTIRDSSRRGRRTDVSRGTADSDVVAVLERLVESERLRADAAEYRYNQMLAAFLKVTNNE
jgi:hypothetical protein